MRSGPAGTREQQARLRAAVPAIRAVVEQVGPKLRRDLRLLQAEDVPAEWQPLLEALKATVHCDPTGQPIADISPAAAGLKWSQQVLRVVRMLNLLSHEILQDLSRDRKTQGLATMLLVEQAVFQLSHDLDEVRLDLKEALRKAPGQSRRSKRCGGERDALRAEVHLGPRPESRSG